MSDISSQFSEPIEVLEGMEAIRRRPQMYLGPIDDASVPTELFMQSLCHAVDEHIDGNCGLLKVSGDGVTASVFYDAGMPLERAEPDSDPKALSFLTSLYACSNHKKHVEVGGEYCAHGLCALTALSERLTAEIVEGGQRAVFIFEKGNHLNGVGLTASDEAEYTRLSFSLDVEIFKDNRFFEHSRVAKRLEQLSTDFPQLKVELTDW